MWADSHPNGGRTQGHRGDDEEAGTYYAFTNYSGGVIKVGDAPGWLAPWDEPFSSDDAKWSMEEKLESGRTLSGLLFSTRYWFIEVTNQDQGIEMWQQCSKIMENNRLFDEIREEIERFEAYQSQRSRPSSAQTGENWEWAGPSS